MKKLACLMFVVVVCAPLFAAETRVVPAPLLPSGTAIRMKLEAPISTDAAVPGDTFSGRVTEPVMFDGRTIIPIGASVQGRVMRVASPRRIKGKPSVHLHPEQIILPDGEVRQITAAVVDTDRPRKFDVDDEGNIRGRGRSAKDNRELLLGSGAGAGVGAIVGGGSGALIGAGVGAVVSTTHWLVGRRSATIPAGTELVLELSRPVEVK
ncbi:MAG: hypothetical protein ACE14L_01500 [Terriglobales bacterium]